ELGITTGHRAIRNVGWAILVRGRAADVAWCGAEIGGSQADAGSKILATLAAAGITAMRVHGPKLAPAIARLVKRGIDVTEGAPFDFARG
ncbi:MAG TPA: hypothetical protein VGO00_30545, partial [Kofleriaceae bacterium]|nr:hypothetical protein [Kofleriaceae bacterium]